jgi:cathepsin A (carboxypeptidase C)
MEDDIRVMIYAGDVDFICNWMGNKAWTMNLDWTGKQSFTSETDHNWMYNNGEKDVHGGMVRTGRPRQGKGALTFLQVFEAGHMVPMDQPQAALSLLNTFLFNKDFY